MKILIVNGYSKTEQGKIKFAEFEALIKQLFKEQKDFIDTETEFVVRSRDNLDDFLYELDSSYVRVSAAKYFDHLDMIFIEGDANLLPWSQTAQKMLILLRMCLKTKKIIFASSFAMQALVFLSATNFERSINVINGEGKGGSIADILSLNLELSKLKHTDYFLDNVTGDLYSYNYETNEWVPKVNIGLHYKKAAQSFESVGRFIIKTPVYKPKQLKEALPSYLSKNTEDFCYLKKIYLQHWALQEMEMEFIVSAKNAWDIHQFNFVNHNKTFIVIAESRRCPQIIVYGDYCVATLFNITKKYPQSVICLKNFIVSKLKELKSMAKNSAMGIEKASELLKNSAADYYNFKIGDVNQQNKRKIQLLRKLPETNMTDKSSSGRPKTANEIFHSGMAFTRHNAQNLIVENNAVGGVISLAPDNINNNNKYSPSNAHNKLGSIVLISTKPEHSLEGTIGFGETNPNAFRSQNHGRNYRADSANSHVNKQKANQLNKYEDSMQRVNSFSQFVHIDPRVDPRLDSQAYDGSNNLKKVKSDHYLTKNKGEIRQMLYPELPKDFVGNDELWVPGNMTNNNPRAGTAFSGNRIRVKMETSYSSRFYSSYNKFKGLDVDEGRNKPCISTASEYLTEDQRLKNLDKERESKIIGPKYVKYVGKDTKPWYIKNYVNLDYSEPPANHKFRQVDKSKWVAGDLKLCG